MLYRHPDGRQPIGVAQQPYPCYDYPLVGPVPAAIRYLIADMKLIYDDPSLTDPTDAPYALPFRIKWLYGLGDVVNPAPSEVVEYIRNPVECWIVDNNGNTVINTYNGAFFRHELAGRLMICTWDVGRAVLQMVFHTHWSPDGTFPPAQEYLQHIFVDDVIIDARAVMPSPRVVRTLGTLGERRDKAHEFITGYNFQIDNELVDSGAGEVPQLYFNAIPGAGDGVFPDCQTESSAIYSIGGVKPDAKGRFFLQADDCTWVRQPIIVVEDITQLRPNSLQIGDNCKPCCDCIDYAQPAVELYRLHGKYRSIGNTLEETRSTYHTTNTNWKSVKALVGRYGISARVIPQYCPQIDIILQLNNYDEEAVHGASLNVNIDTGYAGDIAHKPTLVGDYAQFFTKTGPDDVQQYRRGTLEYADFPTYSAGVYYCDPQGSMHVRLRLQFYDCTPRLVKISLYATVNGFPVTDKEGTEIVIEEQAAICGYVIPDEEEA